MMTAGQVGQLLLQMQPEPSVYKSKERPTLAELEFSVTLNWA